MKKYDIAHSELTNCYYIMCDGKKVAECTEQIANIRAKAIDELTKALCEYNLGIKMYTLEELEGIWADIREIAEKVKEQKDVRV